VFIVFQILYIASIFFSPLATHRHSLVKKGTTRSLRCDSKVNDVRRTRKKKDSKVLAAALTVERGAGITNHMFLHGENQLTDQNSCVETWGFLLICSEEKSELDWPLLRNLNCLVGFL